MRNRLQTLIFATLGLALFASLTTVLVASDAHSDGEIVDSSLPEQSALERALFPRTTDYTMPPLQPNIQMFLFTLIFFGLFLFFMRNSTWIPLLNGLNARDARVANAERDAEHARREVERLRIESEKRLAEVQDQVKALIAQARSEAESEKRRIVSDAEQEAQRIKDEALRELNEAHQAALQSLDQMVDDQVALVTEHVVGRRL